MSEQTKAERLADWIESEAPPADEATCADVATELRRLSAVNGELLEALKLAWPQLIGHAERNARTAIAKAEGKV